MSFDNEWAQREAEFALYQKHHDYKADAICENKSCGYRGNAEEFKNGKFETGSASSWMGKHQAPFKCPKCGSYYTDLIIHGYNHYTIADFAVEILMETGMPSIMWGDIGLLDMISHRAQHTTLRDSHPLNRHGRILTALQHDKRFELWYDSFPERGRGKVRAFDFRPYRAKLMQEIQGLEKCQTK